MTEHTVKCTAQIRFHNTAQWFGSLAKWLSVRLWSSGCGFKSTCSHLNFRFHTCFKQRVRWHSGNYSVDSLWNASEMTRTYSQMHHTDKCSQHSPIIWPVWLNGWVFLSKLSGFAFMSSCSHLNLRFAQGVPWHSGNYKVWIHSKTHP